MNLLGFRISCRAAADKLFYLPLRHPKTQTNLVAIFHKSASLRFSWYESINWRVLLVPANCTHKSTMKKNIFDNLTTLETSFDESGIKKFRARQVISWLFEKRAKSFDDMTDLPSELRKQLADQYSIFSATIGKHEKSSDGTEKLLVKLNDSQHVECVLLRDGQRRSICVSSHAPSAPGAYIVRISSPFLIGDVNQDGNVNLLDVAPFVDLITNGGFQTEADISQDGVVNLLDIAPFIDLLN